MFVGTVESATIESETGVSASGIFFFPVKILREEGPGVAGGAGVPPIISIHSITETVKTAEHVYIKLLAFMHEEWRAFDYNGDCTLRYLPFRFFRARRNKKNRGS